MPVISTITCGTPHFFRPGDFVTVGDRLMLVLCVPFVDVFMARPATRLEGVVHWFRCCAVFFRRLFRSIRGMWPR